MRLTSESRAPNRIRSKCGSHCRPDRIHNQENIRRNPAVRDKREEKPAVGHMAAMCLLLTLATLSFGFGAAPEGGEDVYMYQAAQPFTLLGARVAPGDPSGAKPPAFDFSMYGFEGLGKLMNVHPAFVHFPIALFPVVLLFYGLGVWLKKPPLLIGGRLVLYLAMISLAITVFTGLRAEDSIPHNREIHRMMETHKNTGWVLLSLGVLLTLWSFWHSGQRPKGAWLFVLTAAFASYLVLQNGDIGSRMVYLQGAGVKPAVPAVTGEEQKEKGSGNSESESGHKH